MCTGRLVLVAQTCLDFDLVFEPVEGRRSLPDSCESWANCTCVYCPVRGTASAWQAGLLVLAEIVALEDRRGLADVYFGQNVRQIECGPLWPQFKDGVTLR